MLHISGESGRFAPMFSKTVFRALCLAGLLALPQCKKASNVEIANREKILIVANTAEPQSLDPQVATGVIESNIIRALFEGLCVEDPKTDGVALPGAAERWEHNTDFTEWTFHLRQGATWSDGKPITTEDFLFSYERILTPAFAAKYAGLLYLIDGAEEFNKGKTTDFSTVGVTAPDEYTLKIKLKAPTPFLPELTKHYTWYPVPRHAVLRKGKMAEQHTNWTDLDNIVTNGPFRLKTWQFNYKIEVEKSPTYWDTGTVQLEGIRFLPITNEFTENRMFNTGQLHLTDRVPAEMMDHAKKNNPASLRQETYLGTSFLRCNVAEGPLRKLAIRKAISLAVPRQDIIDHLLKGGQKPCYAITPPFGDYQPPHVVETNLAMAKKTLADAGHANGQGVGELTLLTAKRETSVKLAESLADLLGRELGLRVKIKKYEWQTYLSELSAMNYDLATGGWIGDYIDPTTFLDMWRKGDGNNRTGWENAEYEALLDKAAQIADPAERLKTLAQAEGVMLREYPIVPINWSTKVYLIHPSVKGWHPLLLNNHPYKFVRLETQSK